MINWNTKVLIWFANNEFGTVVFAGLSAVKLNAVIPSCVNTIHKTVNVSLYTEFTFNFHILKETFPYTFTLWRSVDYFLFDKKWNLSSGKIFPSHIKSCRELEIQGKTSMLELLFHAAKLLSSLKNRKHFQYCLLKC